MAQPIGEVDEEYNSTSDADFEPGNAPTTAIDNGDTSSSEDEAAATKPAKNEKRKTTAEDVDFHNSGDEATIAKAKRRKRKGSLEEVDVGGDGGLIKTRAQRRAEVQERKPLVNTTNASVDVDALWAQMATTRKTFETAAKDDLSEAGPRTTQTVQAVSGQPDTNTSKLVVAMKPDTVDNMGVEATITIKRTYKFAGETKTEERTVPVNSAEARLYLEEQSKAVPPQISTMTKPLKPGLLRPKKRASMFSSGASEEAAAASASKGPKLTTLEKSKLDWAQHVDQEGISEELDEHRKAKEGYLGRMDFLGRMELKKEEELLKVKGGK